MANNHDETTPLERVHIRLYAEDVAEIRAKFGAIGMNKAIRTMVHKYLRHIREKAREAQTHNME